MPQNIDFSQHEKAETNETDMEPPPPVIAFKVKTGRTLIKVSPPFLLVLMDWIQCVGFLSLQTAVLNILK